MRRILLILTALLLVAPKPLSAQKPLSQRKWKAITCVVYSQRAGSAIDPNKRDYSVRVDADSIVVSAWGPDGSRGRRSFASTPSLFNSLKTHLAEQGLSSVSPEEAGIIALGGSTHSIACFKGKQRKPCFDAYTTGGTGTLVLKNGRVFDAFERVLPLPVQQIVYEIAPPKGDKRVALIKYRSISPELWRATNLVCYSFTDASTAPEYHRSYDISVSKDSIVVNVTCYGDLLLRTAYPCTQEKFEAVKAHLAAQDISKGRANADNLPDGGTTDALLFFKDGDDKPYFSAASYAGTGTLRVGKGRAADAFLEALPEPLEKIIDRTRDQ